MCNCASLSRMYCDFVRFGVNYILCCVQATIVRNAKDTAHTKAERNILEGVKVLMSYLLFVLV